MSSIDLIDFIEVVSGKELCPYQKYFIAHMDRVRTKKKEREFLVNYAKPTLGSIGSTLLDIAEEFDFELGEEND